MGLMAHRGSSSTSPAIIDVIDGVQGSVEVLWSTRDDVATCLLLLLTMALMLKEAELGSLRRDDLSDWRRGRGWAVVKERSKDGKGLCPPGTAMMFNVLLSKSVVGF